MRKVILLFLLVILVMPIYAKKITIVVNPNEADIKVNGSLYGQGSVVVDVKKDDFVAM